jgi:hypothetical protein
MEIEDLINSVVDQDFSKAAPTFAEIMQSKMDDALEQEKIAQADQVFNGVTDEPSEEDEDLVDDITDEELDDAIDELEVDDETEEEVA